MTRTANTPSTPQLQLVESAPAGTLLDHPNIPNAAEVWPLLIRRAKTSLDLSYFYVQNGQGRVLERVLQEIEMAVARGVRVRLLVDNLFYKKYPESVDRLASNGILVRMLDLRPHGVMHAKYFLVDGRLVFLGSQNMAWRSLEYDQEIGVACRVPEVVDVFSRVFQMDWARAGNERPPQTGEAPAFPVNVTQGRGKLEVTAAASPQGLLPSGVIWELPEILWRIDNAKTTVNVQVMSYDTDSREGGRFLALDAALRRAANRGVGVQLLVTDPKKSESSLSALFRLANVRGIQVRSIRFLHSSIGYRAFAGIAHAKYMVVDGEHAWIGTSNWEGDYFTASRNVALFVSGRAFVGTLQRVFRDAFEGPYAEALGRSPAYERPWIE